MPVLPGGLLRRTDVAVRLAVSERTVRRWGATGRLDERKVGPRAVRVTEASVERLVSSGARTEAA
jgi:excisionase family DNA binding protein